MDVLSVLIMIGIIAISPLWYSFSFNLIFVGYALFDELRLSIVFFAVVTRILLYPLRLLERKKIKEAAHFAEQMKLADASGGDQVVIKERYKEIQKEHKSSFTFIEFNYIFLLMHLIVTSIILHLDFTDPNIAQGIFSFIPQPPLPINVVSWLPFVGVANLMQPNHQQNIVTAAGTFLYGLFEIFAHKKTSKAQIIRYLFIFPVCAYWIAHYVASGFEFSVIVFQALSLVIFALEFLFTRKKKVEVY